MNHEEPPECPKYFTNLEGARRTIQALTQRVPRKTIWIVSECASTPATGAHLRHHHFARGLAARGHRVTVIAAGWHHLLRSTPEDPTITERIDGYDFVRLPMPRYAHAHDRRRVLNWLLFAWGVARLHRRLPERPDIILCSSPSPFAFLGAERLARRFGARLVFEVRDLWPMTLVEIGGHPPSHPLIKLMQWVEDRAYRRADRVLSSLPGAVEHMVARGMDRKKFSWIPTGCVPPNNAVVPLPTAIRDQIPKGKFLVGYAGTFGLANALDNLLSAAERLQGRSDIAFALVGDGRERSRLKTAARDRGLTNLHFIDAVPNAVLPSLMRSFDACFIGWLRSPLYRYGVAANKLCDYLQSGRPILHAYSGGDDLVAAYGAGLTVPAEDPAALADAVLRLQALPAHSRHMMGERGEKAARDRHGCPALVEQLEAVLVGAQQRQLSAPQFAPGFCVNHEEPPERPKSFTNLEARGGA